MFVLCENPNTADLTAIRKAVAAVNNTTANSESFSGFVVNPELLKKLENLVIDYKSDQPRAIIKKVEIGCPVQLKNHVERFFENVSSILSGTEVGFDCGIIPTEITHHEERTFYAGSGKTVVVIASRTYFVIPKQPITDQKMVLQLEQNLSSMARKKFGYKQPNALECKPLLVFEMLCDRLTEIVENLETYKKLFKKSKEITKDDIIHVHDACDMLRVSLKIYDNIQEEIFNEKAELDSQKAQVALLKEEYQHLTNNEKQIIARKNQEYEKRCSDFFTNRLINAFSNLLRKLKSLNVPLEVQEKVQEQFQEELEIFEDFDLQQ